MLIFKIRIEWFIKLRQGKWCNFQDKSVENMFSKRAILVIKKSLEKLLSVKDC